MDLGQQQGSSSSSQQRPQPAIVPQNMSGKISHPSDKEFHLEMMTQPFQSIATEWTDEKRPRSHKSMPPSLFNKKSLTLTERKATEWPLEPPPVIALRTANGSELEHHGVLTACPNVFCTATLTDSKGRPVSSEFMRGRHSSSLIKLDKGKTPKLKTDAPAIGVFLFDQIHIRYPGEYCLLFTLFEMQMHDQGMHAVVHNLVRSDPFTVQPQPRRLPKPGPPAEILLALAAQGAKIKIRKPNEDRVKRKTDWSLEANGNDMGNQYEIMQPPAPEIHYNHNAMTSVQMSIPQQAFVQPNMATMAPHFQMAMPAQPSFPNYMQTTMPQDMNFAPNFDPTQTFQFGGFQPGHGYGNGYNNY